MKERPHQHQPVLQAGAPLDRARAAMILLHGRGADARDILSLADEIDQPDFAFFAPEAANNTWYPFSFLSPLANNEPGISSGLQAIDDVMRKLRESGFPEERVFLGGFSQGACLMLEYVARHARRYGGIAAFSGGLIGPEGTPRDYAGSLEGTPVFLGCSDRDPHIPAARVRESAAVFRRMGGEVEYKLYVNMGHTINRDELRVLEEMMSRLVEKVPGKRVE